MWLNLIVVLLVLLGAFLWASKARGYGMFSAFLAFACTLAAGAIAFAAWEPLVYGLILAKANPASGFGRILQDTAWGIGLLLPFIIALAVLRIAVDSLVRHNLRFSEVANFIGGAVFGLGIMTITMGIVVISFGHMRVGAGLLGHAPIEEVGGSPVYQSSLWVPVDKLTTRLYEMLSVGSFDTSTPLAERNPNVFEQAAMLRMSYEKGKGRTVLIPNQVDVVGRYTVADDAIASLQKFDDKGNAAAAQKALYPSGEEAPSNGRVEGYIVRFKSGAKEKGGNVVVTTEQLRLICTTQDGESLGIHPFAVIAPPEAGRQALVRFRFDTKETPISSVGGGSDAVFGFEFVVPPNATVTDLLVKGVRFDLEATPPATEFRTARARDEAVADASVFTKFNVTVAGGSGAPELDTAGSENIAPTSTGDYEAVAISERLPDGLTLNRQTLSGLELDGDGLIISGETQVARGQLGSPGLDQKLRVDRFRAARGTRIVQVDLSIDGKRSIYGRSVELAEQILPPMLIDQSGTVYEAVGYVYSEGDVINIRFTPDRPLRAISEVPTLSRAKRDQSLRILFMPTQGVRVQSFTLGSKEIARFDGEGLLVAK